MSAAIAGAVIAEAPNGALLHFNWLGYIVMAIALVSLSLMYFVHKAVPEFGAALTRCHDHALANDALATDNPVDGAKSA